MVQPNPYGGPPQPQPQPAPQWQPPPAPQQAPIPPTVIALGKRGKRAGLGLAVVCGGIGLVSIISLFTGGVEDGATIGVVIVGSIFLLLGLAGLFMAVFGPDHRIVIDAAGIRLDGAPPSRAWQTGWPELAVVATSTASKVNPQGVPMRSVLVRLEFIPVDYQRFATEHPQLRPFFGRQNDYGAYRIPVGSGKKIAHALDGGLRAFGQQRYRGVVDEGIAWGFRYT